MAVPRMPTGCADCMARKVESSVASTKPSPRWFREERKLRVVSPETSGDHCGFEKELKPCLTSSVGSVPSVFIIQMRDEPPLRELWKAMMSPPGDQAGPPSLAELFVSRVCEAPAEVIL